MKYIVKTTNNITICTCDDKAKAELVIDAFEWMDGETGSEPVDYTIVEIGPKPTHMTPFWKDLSNQIKPYRG